MERIGLAFLAALAGFFVGLVIWWGISSTPGFRFGFGYYLYFGCFLAVGGFLFALFKPEATLNFLGNFMERVWHFSNQVLIWFRFFR
ncbi:MAG: hypothetical protein KY410_01490 [Proteobacteria bacterium]|nr:hypothetical protein [Pseudomonadota bacterium]